MAKFKQRGRSPTPYRQGPTKHVSRRRSPHLKNQDFNGRRNENPIHPCFLKVKTDTCRGGDHRSMMNKILAGRFSDGINYLNFLKGFELF